ncbi:MAG: AAA family ATPase, partial [Aggregatilineales bacterium]
MAQRLRERLNLQATQNFVGRTQEIAQLLHLLDGQDTPVVFVHGIGGIGKSSLLEFFAGQAQTLGAVVINLDCRAIKPSTEGFLHELSAAIGSDASDVEQVALRLSRLGECVILTLDTYEVFRMMDTWLRQVFIPALNDNVHIVFFGREAPVSTWYTTPGWNRMVQSILLGPLSNPEAKELLLQCGVPELDTPRVTQLTHGHPLALKLAAATIAERPNLNLKEVESQYIVTELTQLYLSDVPDPVAREALEAASVVRRTTHSLLSVMLPDLAPHDAYDRLQVLPFVDSASDGLMIHDLVQQAIVAHLRAADPERYSKYRRAAWHQLRSEFSPSSRAMIWRYTADMIYLIDNPAIHDVFFPSDAHVYAVEQATPHDLAAIRA